MRIMIKGTFIGLLFSFMAISSLFGQKASINGRIVNKVTNEPIPFATVLVDTLGTGAVSDIDGYYEIENLTPGVYSIQCSYIGFKKKYLYEVRVTSSRPTVLDIYLEQENTTLEEVSIVADPFNRTDESPLSLRNISASEIYRNPGGNRDISKVIQILPGVATTVSFRNDIIVRGGAPNENRFYIDGIEIPNINHFATQGSSGGPVGMLNVNFIKEVDFYSGAFPANRGNALSSILEFKQVSGNNQGLSGSFMVGSSDAGITLDGPIGQKSDFILSARRSYLQFLFKALALPFLPTYNDFQLKFSSRINDKNTLTVIGLGAIDDFELNTDVNNDVNDEETIKRNNYILGNLPVNTQWNYATGINWTHFSKNSYQTIVVSRNHLKNKSIKYEDNIEQASLLLLDYNSEEIENKVRIESFSNKKGWSLNYGVGYEHAIYKNSTFRRTEINNQVDTVNFSSELRFNKYSFFGQASKRFFAERLSFSLGVRSDFNDYSSRMSNPLEQISPRVSLSYRLPFNVNVNFNIGRYYQLPPYTILGYRNTLGALVNKTNGIKYISGTHIVVGFDYSPTQFSKVSLEGFYKQYANYPLLLNDSISLANLGGDFGTIGNEPASSDSDGRSYGIELLVQQKLSTSIYGILSYTWVRSEFEDKLGNLRPSSWDNRHLLNLTAGKRFKRNWEVGLKFRLLGGPPFTPYDIQLSSQKPIWDVTRQGIRDWDRLNEDRSKVFHGLDIRVDKTWYFKRWAINIYIDVQNVYNYQLEGQPYLDVQRDAAGAPLTDPNDPNQYLLEEIENSTGRILPSIGLMIEF